MATCTNGELDARVFAELTVDARAAASAEDHARALTLFDKALGLWRGETLAGVHLDGDAQIDVARLGQERRLVAEERIDSALAMGRHRELVPGARAHGCRGSAARAPTRSAHARALPRRTGTEALERYREGRQLLVERAGIEPGPELRRLERSILQHDPALELAPPRQEVEHPPNSTPARRRRLPLMVISGVVLVAAIALLGFAFWHSDSGCTLARIDANSVVAIHPHNNRLVSQVSVKPGPGPVAAGFGSLWVVNEFDSTVSRINPSTGTTIQTIAVDGDPTAIAAGAGFVWVVCSDTRSVNQINPQVDRRVQRVPVGNGPSGIAISPGTCVGDEPTGRHDHRDRLARRQSPPALDAGPSPSDVAYGMGALWISNASSSTASRLDLSSRDRREFAVGNGPEAVTTGFGAAWVANSLDGTVSSIDAKSDVVTTFAVGPGPRRCSPATRRSGSPTAMARESSASIPPASTSSRRSVWEAPRKPSRRSAAGSG